jgi:hypothetical protein
VADGAARDSGGGGGGDGGDAAAGADGGGGGGSDAGKGGPPGAPEVAVAATLTGAQTRPRVAAAADDAFAVAWEGTDGLGRGIKVRCFDATGAPAGGEVSLNTSTLGDQIAPAVAVSRSSGTVLVAWADTGGMTDEVRYKVLAAPSAGCAPSSPSDLLANSTTVGDQAQPSLEALDGGGFVAAWRDTSAVSAAVHARYFDDLGSPLGAEFLVNAAPPSGGDIARPLALDYPAGVWFAWEGPDGAGEGIASRPFTAAGMPLQPGDGAANVLTAGNQIRPSAAWSPLGAGAAVVWAHDSGLGGGTPDLVDVYLRRFDAMLAPLDTTELVLSTAVDGSCDEIGPPALDGCARPAVGVAGDGTFLAVWSAVRSGVTDASGSGLRGRRFDMTSFVDAEDFPVNTSTGGDQLHPDVVGRSDGSFVVVWTSSFGAPVDQDVRARILGP